MDNDHNFLLYIFSVLTHEQIVGLFCELSDEGGIYM
jgi:hypothetical protein